MWTISQEGVNNMKKMRDNLRKSIIEEKAADKRIIARRKRSLFTGPIMEKFHKYGRTPEIIKEYDFYKNMTDDEIMAYNPPTEQPKKLKIGVKRINETEAIIKNQEKTIKGKKKQILNEQDYLNTMGKIMTGESNFIDNKGKWAVATELDVKDGLNPKIRRALKKSIIEQANKIKGTNITMDF